MLIIENEIARDDSRWKTQWSGWIKAELPRHIGPTLQVTFKDQGRSEIKSKHFLGRSGMRSEKNGACMKRWWLMIGSYTREAWQYCSKWWSIISTYISRKPKAYLYICIRVAVTDKTVDSANIHIWKSREIFPRNSRRIFLKQLSCNKWLFRTINNFKYF